MCRSVRCSSDCGPSVVEQRRQRGPVGGLELVAAALRPAGANQARAYSPARGCAGGSRSIGKSRSAVTCQPAVGQPRRPGRAEGRHLLGVRRRRARPITRSSKPGPVPRSSGRKRSGSGNSATAISPPGGGGGEHVAAAPRPGRPGGAATSTPRSGRADRDRASRRRGPPRRRAPGLGQAELAAPCRCSRRSDLGRDVDRGHRRPPGSAGPARARRCRCPRRGRAAGPGVAAGRRVPHPVERRRPVVRPAPRRPGRAGRHAVGRSCSCPCALPVPVPVPRDLLRARAVRPVS